MKNRNTQSTEFPTSEILIDTSTEVGHGRIYLNVPFSEKEQVKSLGAKWDKEQKSWFVPEEIAPKTVDGLFKRWMEIPQSLTAQDIRTQFSDALINAGLIVGDAPPMDGEWHRTTVATSRKTKALKGAYIANVQDAMPNGYIKNFDTGYAAPWFPQGMILTDEQRHQFEHQAATNRTVREQKLAETQEQVAARCAKEWASLPDAENHPYLEHKKVKAFGLRMDGDNLVTPVRDANGKIWSLQYISSDLEKIKLYKKDGRKTGNFHVLGSLEGAQTVLFAEGYATCASLHMGTGLPVVEVFDSGNIDAVFQTLAPNLIGVEKILCADDDRVSLEKVAKTINNENLLKRFNLSNGICTEEIKAALEYGKTVNLAGTSVCSLHLEYSFPQEHGGFNRVVGEIVNTQTGDHLPIIINNVGMEKAWAAAQTHGAKMVAPLFGSGSYQENTLTDFNDLHIHEGLDRVRIQIAKVVDINRVKSTAIETQRRYITNERR